MKTVTKIWGSVIGVATMILSVPTVHDPIISYATAHPVFGTISTIITGLAGLLALLHNPTATPSK